MSKSWSLLALLLAGWLGERSFAGDAKTADKPPPELGRVPFLRDYAAAVEQAKKEKKPLFVLFDEVPG